MALINPNTYIKQLRDFEDRLSDAITAFAGNIKFVYFHAVWFAIWIVANLGLLGLAWKFDAFPFGLLTMIVSLEAIFLSTFVMISQNRSSEKAEIRAQLDYETDLQAEKEIGIIMRTLVRVAEKQGVDIADLTSEMDEVRHLAKREAEQRTERRTARAKQRRA
jgi:uncharacterized membrane protein